MVALTFVLIVCVVFVGIYGTLFCVFFQRRSGYNQGRRRLNGRAFRAQREDSIRRTVYVSEIDHNVSRNPKQFLC